MMKDEFLTAKGAKSAKIFRTLICFFGMKTRFGLRGRLVRFREALCYAVSLHGEINIKSNTSSLLTYKLNRCSILVTEGDI